MSHIPIIEKAYVLIAIHLSFASEKVLLAGTGLLSDLLEESESIDVDQAIKLVHNLVIHSYTTNTAAIYGRQLGIASHGPVGYATIAAPTLGKALITFTDWFQVRCETYSCRILEQDQGFEIYIYDTTGDRVFTEFFFEAITRAIEVLIELIIGRTPKGETVLYFKAAAQNRKELMISEYDSALNFDSDANKLVIPKSLWTYRSPLYDEDSYQYNLRKCQQLMDALKEKGRLDLTVRNLIRKHFDKLSLTDCSEMNPPTQRDICQALLLTERTLIRKLTDCNTTFRGILEEERYKYAMLLLGQVRYTVYRVSEILGYKESANFCRAFKRWSGKSPSAYRRNLPAL